MGRPLTTDGPTALGANEYSRRWYKKNRTRIRNTPNAQLTLRIKAIAAYGGKCVCCGCDEFILLDLDHINNDGSTWRKHFKDPRRELRWLRDHGWPPDRLQVLCVVCHRRKTIWNKQEGAVSLTVPHSIT